MNFALTSMLFVTLANVLFRKTMSLRGMIVPNDSSIAFRNLVGTAVVLVGLFLLNAVIRSLMGTGTAAVLCGVASGLVVCFGAISLRCPSVRSHPRFRSSLKTVAVSALLVSASAVSVAATRTVGEVPGYCDECKENLSIGTWKTSPSCQNDEKHALDTSPCTESTWAWDNQSLTEIPSAPACQACDPQIMSQSQLQGLFGSTRIVFVGDSNLRKVYHAMNAELDPAYDFDDQFSMKVRTRWTDCVMPMTSLCSVAFSTLSRFEICTSSLGS